MGDDKKNLNINAESFVPRKYNQNTNMDHNLNNTSNSNPNPNRDAEVNLNTMSRMAAVNSNNSNTSSTWPANVNYAQHDINSELTRQLANLSLYSYDAQQYQMYQLLLQSQLAAAAASSPHPSATTTGAAPPSYIHLSPRYPTSNTNTPSSTSTTPNSHVPNILHHHHQSLQHHHHPSATSTSNTATVPPTNLSSIIPSPAGRSRRNSCLTVKTFNTGDEETNKKLTKLYKEVNPRSEFCWDLRNSRFFVIKSYTEDHVHRSIKYGEWCSTQKGNEILDNAYRSVTTAPSSANMAGGTFKPGTVLLFFSVNGSGYFCGVAEMTSRFDPSRRGAHWTNDSMLPGGGSRWSGGFDVRWKYVKDVPNKYLKHIILEHNENRPVTNSRDATEIKPREKGIETLRIIHEYHNNSSLFDDFDYYETRERCHNVSTATTTQNTFTH